MDFKNVVMLILFLIASIGIAVSDSTSQTSSYSNISAQEGDLVWDELTASSSTYTWDARTFSGFYYDLDSGKLSESLTIIDIGRNIDSNDIVYEAVPIETDFAHEEWGSYETVGFLGEEYFVAYTNNTTIIGGSDDLNMLSVGQLSKVLIDDDEHVVVYSDSSLLLNDGYALDIVDILYEGNSVLLALTKDGVEIEQKNVSVYDHYVYKTNIGDCKNVTLIAVRPVDCFIGMISEIVVFEGIFQISDDYLDIEAGDSYANMRVMHINETNIQMKNSGTVTLNKGNLVELMGDILLNVADDETLRFKPSVDRTAAGTYELRGITAENERVNWTPLNFEYFYYDINNDLGTEKIILTNLNGRDIEENCMEYTTSIQESYFKANYSDLDTSLYPTKYPVMGLFGEMYIPLKNNTSNILTRLLLDSDDEYHLQLGENLSVNDEYTLFLKYANVDEKKVSIEILKNRQEKYNQTITLGTYGGTIVYEEDIAGMDTVEIMRIHLSNISTDQTVAIDGIWLRDDQDILKIDNGDTFGELSVSDIGSNYLRMQNNNTITLSKDSIIDIAGNFSFRIANDDTLRYYPFTEVITPEPLTIVQLTPDAPYASSYEGDMTTFDIELNEIADITWILDEEILYTNESVMSASYTNISNTSGTYNLKVVAENENGILQNEWTWTVKAHLSDSIITNPIGDDCSMHIGEKKDFYINTSRTSTIDWYLDNTHIQTDKNVSTANYTFDSLINNSSSSGHHYIKAIVSDKSETYEKNWDCSISKILMRTGQTWELRNGYSLTPHLIDIDGDQILLNLSRNGELVDQHIASADNYYYYSRSFNGSDEMIVNIYISDLFQSQFYGIVVISQIEQYTDAGTLDTDPTILLESDEVWDIGNNYSVRVIDVGKESDYCILSLERDGSVVDKRVVSENSNYVYQRLNEHTGETVTIVELPVLNTLISTSEQFIELSTNYTLYSDENTLDTESFLFIQVGDIWKLYNGYSVIIDEISGKKALISIDKDGTVIDHDIIEEDATFAYSRFDPSTQIIHNIVTFNISKIFDGISNDCIELEPVYHVGSDEGTVALENKSIMETGSSLDIGEGYTLDLMYVDIYAKKAYFHLLRNGQVADKIILGSGEYYYFERSVNGNEQTVISFLMDDVFSGETNKIAMIRDIFLDPYLANYDNSIEDTEKDDIRIRSLLYSAIDLSNITGPNDEDHITIGATDFPGLLYDNDENVSTETLKIFGGSYSNGNTIEADGLLYTTKIMLTGFKSSNIEGSYKFIGIFGERYTPLKTNMPHKLAEVLVDIDEKIVIPLGETLQLPNGYSIEAKQIDVEGDKVWVELAKDNEFIEDEIIDISTTGNTWIYDKDIAGEDDVVVMAMNVTKLFQEESEGMMVIEGLWLIDFENTHLIETGDIFGQLEVTEIGSDYLRFTNPEPIDLTRNSSVKIAGDLYFDIDDNDDLSFCIVKESVDANIQEIRGSVVEDKTTAEWTSVNFEGFNYISDEPLETERLLLNLSDRTIEENRLLYDTNPFLIDLKHDEWGEYTAIGFLGEKYLAGYDDLTTFQESNVSLLSNSILSRVLIDSNNHYVLYPESSLALREGYEMEVIHINANNSSAIVSLTKEGTIVDTTTVYSCNDYTYRTDLSSVDNITTIAVHFTDITNQTGTNSISIEGIFQISDEYLTLSSSDLYGNMEISNFSEESISMYNGHEIILSRASSVNITENIHFKVADSDKVRFYPYMDVMTTPLDIMTFGPSHASLKFYPGNCQNFSITANKECDITWMVNGTEMQVNGSCVSSCYSYTPASAGSYNITVFAETATENAQRTWDLAVTSTTSSTEATTSTGSSSGGGGGGGSTGEDYDNIMKKEVVREVVNKDIETSYHFVEEENAIESIKFIALKNAGPISATIEVLNDRSSFADKDPSGEVYQNMNIWIGKTGFATSDNIKDIQIRFKVSKEWIKENSIIGSSIYLYRYHDDIWNQLNTWKVEEDDDYIYFASETPGFSPFVITGMSELGTEDKERYNVPAENVRTEHLTDIDESGDLEDINSIPGLSGTPIVILIAFTALVMRKKD
ncbi:S-layer protein domain-containing protein [Methanolobus profundi]|uniref:S-layer family duplication domain-containing protein n=1 Tax=Methanolobus profundi TaxID=487685 RepID=A0A1I4PEQ0_9EURY|nr:S-layer protein domain-containing protein [Methanolobus profundi]SFM26229.1 S-layer family duplication domain-containing protein [Methanolobus profundi]